MNQSEKVQNQSGSSSMVDWHLLREKTVALIGVGALGTVVANHLVRNGIGSIRLIDRDFVDKSNLQRQMLFDETDVKQNKPKVIAAAEKLSVIHPDVHIETYIKDVNASTIEELVKGCDIIIDATDNMQTRFLINDVSIKHHIPWVYGGAIRSRGMYLSMIPGETPCLQCLFPGTYHQHGETCDTVGVLGPLVHIVASYQATEACKILLGCKEVRNDNLTHIDIWDHDYDEMPIAGTRNPTCECCSKKVFTYLDQHGKDMYTTSLCGRDSIQITPVNSTQINFHSWEKKWLSVGKVTRTPFLLRLEYDSYVLTLFQDGRLLIKGVHDEVEAKKLYSRFIGN